jgi:aryl-alcohol dehydrogenase-like predicted oxidoreductase
MERYNKSQARTATEEYVKVAQKHGLTPTQLALAWCRCVFVAAGKGTACVGVGIVGGCV